EPGPRAPGAAPAPGARSRTYACVPDLRAGTRRDDAPARATIAVPVTHRAVPALRWIRTRVPSGNRSAPRRARDPPHRRAAAREGSHDPRASARRAVHPRGGAGLHAAAREDALARRRSARRPRHEAGRVQAARRTRGSRRDEQIRTRLIIVVTPALTRRTARRYSCVGAHPQPELIMRMMPLFLLALAVLPGALEAQQVRARVIDADRRSALTAVQVV